MIDPDHFDEYQRTRYEKLLALRAAGIEPYPLRSERSHTSREAVEALEAAGERGERPAP